MNSLQRLSLVGLHPRNARYWRVVEPANLERRLLEMGTPKRSRIARESIKSGGGDIRYKKPLDVRAQKRSMNRASKEFREL
jgi:hypothetical protein